MRSVLVTSMLLLVSTAALGGETTTRFEPGQGLVVESADGDFGLTTKLFGQLLYTYEHDVPEGDAAHSVQIRRARLDFKGNWFGPHNRFHLQLAFSPRDMQFVDGSPTKSPVFDLELIFDHLRDLSFRAGQYRVPFSRQRRVPIAKLQLVDRALGNMEFNLDRDIGFDFYSHDLFGVDLLRYNLGVYVGEGRDGFEATDLGLMYVARLEIVPLGGFAEYVEADLERREKPGLALGAAYAYLDEGKGNKGILGAAPTDGGTTDSHNVTADLMFKLRGFSLLTEFFYRNGKRDFGDATFVDATGAELPAAREVPRDGIGWFAQLGWLLPRLPLEIIGRYSQVHPHGDDTSLVRRDEAGGGLGWYIFGPSMKVSADYFHQFENGDTSIQDQLRIQLQAGF